MNVGVWKKGVVGGREMCGTSVFVCVGLKKKGKGEMW